MAESLTEYLKENGINEYTTKRINDTNYCVYNFKGNNRDKVVIVGKMFSFKYSLQLSGWQGKACQPTHPE